VVHLPRCGVTSVEWGQSAVRQIVRAAGDAKDHERVGLTFVPTHQDGTAISAFAFDRRIKRFQHWRRPGHPFNERRRTTLRVFCRRASIAATSSKFEVSTKYPAITNLVSFNLSAPAYRRRTANRRYAKRLSRIFTWSSIELIDAAENGCSREPQLRIANRPVKVLRLLGPPQ
jgi:hypothetical protein